MKPFSSRKWSAQYMGLVSLSFCIVPLSWGALHMFGTCWWELRRLRQCRMPVNSLGKSGSHFWKWAMSPLANVVTITVCLIFQTFSFAFVFWAAVTELGTLGYTLCEHLHVHIHTYICVNEAFGCNLVTFLNQTCSFDWSEVRWGSKNKHHKYTCLKGIGPHIQKNHVLLTTPHSVVNTIGKSYVFS